MPGYSWRKDTGLSSKDTTPAQILAVFNNMKRNDPKIISPSDIIDDVTFDSVYQQKKEINTSSPGNLMKPSFTGSGADEQSVQIKFH
jgi:pyruvate-ferredoxin/flavodoxin oxidoreductase